MHCPGPNRFAVRPQLKTQPRQSLSRQQIDIIAAIWAIQLVVSPLWLRRYCFGPFERLWRSLTNRPLQGMRNQH